MIIIKEYKTFSLIGEFQGEWLYGTIQNWFITFDKQAFFGNPSNFIGITG